MIAAPGKNAATKITPSPISIRWLRIIPVALIMYTIAFIDRTNISLALPWISRDLHLDPPQAGTVAGIFFWGYFVLQIPGGHLAKHHQTFAIELVEVFPRGPMRHQIGIGQQYARCIRVRPEHTDRFA